MTSTPKEKILIIGSGAFGTAIATCIHSSNNPVTILSRNNYNFASLQKHCSLKNCQMETFDHFKSNFSDYSLIILAIPCQSIRNVTEWMIQHTKKFTTKKKKIQNKIKIISAAKGIETNTLLLPSQILQSIWKNSASIGALSGPSFASEMLEGKPTCVVVASQCQELLSLTSKILHKPYFRIYDSKDIIGIEIAGALKNVIAMVAGAVDGLNLGSNARAAVITRGLSEIVRIGTKLGADPVTFLGLSGVGDLILTCTGNLSRNRQFGFRISQGEDIKLIIQSMKQVIEGYTTTNSAYLLCKKHDIDASIIKTAYNVLYEQKPILNAVKDLIERRQKSEFN